jgi:hypothetical protein
MGKQSSNKKVQRAARAGGGRKAARRAQSSMLWPAVITVVVLLGVLLIVVSRGENQAGATERPRLFQEFPEDHWHEAFGINICGSYQPDLPEAVNSGIHTHGDGLIHVEATNSAETGANATLGKFVSDYGSRFRVTDTEIRLPGGKTYKNGDKCGDKPGRVAVYRWDSATDKTPTIITNDIDKIRIGNQKVVTFSFNPAGTTLEQPASVKGLQDPNAGEGGGSTATTLAPTGTTTAGSSDTTVPGSAPATTEGSTASSAPPTTTP